MHRAILLYSILLFSYLTMAQRLPVNWYKAQAAFENGESRSALQLIDSCITKSEKNYLFWNRRGEILLNQRDYPNAIESLLKSEKFKQGSSSFFLAKSYCALGDTASCFFWLEKHLNQSDKLKESRIKLDPAFNTITSTKHWRLIWNKEWYSTFEKLVADIDYNISNSRWDETLDLLNQWLKGSRQRHLLLAYRAKVFFEVGSYRLSVDDYSKALRKSKKNHEYFAGRAQSYLALSRFPLAINDLTKAIEYSGGDPKYYRLRAEVYFLDKKFEKAFDDISYYVQFYPGDVKSSFLFAKIAVESGNYIDALLHLGKLIKANPNDPAFHFYRGSVYFKTQNYQFAEMDLNIAIENKYNLSESFYMRGLARLNLSKKDEACSDWENALKNGSFKSQEMLYKYCKKNTTNR